MSHSSSIPLWAKSRRQDSAVDAPTVAEHCHAVRWAADAVWQHVHQELHDRADLSDAELLRLHRLYLVAALLHDIGKANDAFQGMLSGQLPALGKRQPVRHEILSALIAWDENLMGRWLRTALSNDDDFWAVLWAAGGHHLELRRQRFGEVEDPLIQIGNVPQTVTLYAGHEQVRDVFVAICEVLRGGEHTVTDPPKAAQVVFDTLEDGDNPIALPLRLFVRESQQAWRKRQHDGDFRRRLAVLKTLLIAADVAGSALDPGDGQTSASTWIRDALSRELTSSQLDRVVAGRTPRGFQAKVATSETLVTVVAAGCGNGKTTAAYLWARKWAAGRKLFFCYPTTGTASAGFKDYLLEPSLERVLIADIQHSRAIVDRLELFGSPETDAIEEVRRLESLQAWGQQVIACTVDTVLGLVQNQRRPLFGFPAITRGAFVFDEIHSYDRRLFGELLTFLRTFPGAPVLLMSATISPARLAAIKSALGERMDGVILGDEELEAITRYSIEDVPELGDCWAAVGEAVERQHKVLWVCNTINDAVTVFRNASRRFPQAAAWLYHSRYRYRDRVKRQNDVVAEFSYADEGKTRRRKPGAAIAVTTQVCEMSLDLDADLLVTARCPLSALIQRLGRLHRFAHQNDPYGRNARRCLIYPFEGRPYHKDELPQQMTAADEAVKALAGEACSQRMLADRFAEQMKKLSEDWSQPVYSAWLDGGWQSEALPARDGDNSITLVRQDDLEQIEGRPSPEKMIGLTIPMLLKRGVRFSGWQRRHGYLTAPTGTIAYDPVEGASWA